MKNGKELFKTILINLQEKGFILASFKMPKEGHTLKYSDIPINKKLYKEIYKRI